MKLKFLIVALMVSALAGLSAQDLKAYNNGSLQFVPPGTSFELPASDQLIGVSKVYYRVNTGEQQEYSAPVVFNDEGRQTLYYWSEDLLGNVAPIQSYTFVVDSTAPVVTHATRGASFVKDDVIHLKSTTGLLLAATDLGAGVDAIYFSLDKANYIKFNDEAFVAEEGERSAWVYATDRVGNKSEPTEIKLVVDNTPPTVSIVPVEELQVVRGERYSKAGNQIAVRATDDVSDVRSIEVSVNRHEFFNYTDPLPFSEPGNYSIRARATDNLGNVSAVVELNFIVDTGYPVVGVGKPLVATVPAAPTDAAPAAPAASAQ